MSPRKKQQVDNPMPVNMEQYDLPAFEPGSQYEVRLRETVDMGHGMVLRPSSAKIMLSGEKAAELRSKILWAQKVKFLEH